MKREELLKRLREAGCELARQGGRHDWWVQPKTGVQQAVPRHREINEQLARHIVKMLGGAGR